MPIHLIAFEGSHESPKHTKKITVCTPWWTFVTIGKMSNVYQNVTFSLLLTPLGSYYDYDYDNAFTYWHGSL